jgi:hypothetical protein
MTALIIMLAGWRMAASSRTIARLHIAWLRETCPDMTPRDAAALIGAWEWTWEGVMSAYARAWEALPEAVRREGSQ